MKVEAKAMYMSAAETTDEGATVVEPTFFGQGKGNVTMFKVTDDNGNELDQALLQVSAKGKLALARVKKN